MQPQGIIERVWPGRAATWEPLGGGITNHNFKVSVDGSEFVLRIGGKDTALLGIDRRAEESASRMAADLGIGPEVVAFVEPEGYLVTRFIHGEPLPVDRIRSPRWTERVAAAVGRIHAAPPILGRFDAHRVVERYRDTAGDHGVPAPEGFDRAQEVARRIEAARGPQARVPCHNDLLNANLLAEGDQVRIVDWEYAGMGDRFFDLANLSVNHGFEAEQDEALLSAYFGTFRQADFASLRLLRFMSDLREAMWGVVQQGISELDVDFRAYAAEHFERLRATAADPRFEGWLSTVAEARP